MPMHLSSLSCLLLASACFACGSSSSSDGATGGSAGAGGGSGGTAGGGGTGGTSGGGSDCQPAGVPDTLPDVGGTWALRRVTPRLAQPPGFAEPVESEIISLILVEHTQTGTNVDVTGDFCFRENKEAPGAIVDVIVPSAYFGALGDINMPAAYTQDPDGVFRYSIPRYYETEGVNLADPENDTLPTEPTDPRIFDMDGDGKPGGTIRLAGIASGEIHSLVLGWFEFEGAPVASDRIEGLIRFDATQSSVSAEPPNLLDLTVSDFPNPMRCASFSLVKIPDGSGCDFVVDNADTLFP